MLAERLGVSPFTAYDMLRLLEDKGMVTSEYHLSPDKSGPGRAERVFLPTRQAHDIFARLTGNVGGADWEAFKLQVLERTRKGELKGKELAEEMLARFPPDVSGPPRYCIEVMTIVALRLRSTTGRRILVEHISEILPTQKPATRSNLCLLGGFALGILVNEDINDREWEQQLFEHVQRYLDIVIKLSVKDCRLLGEHLMMVFAPFAETS